jgi:hypothetical protein
MGRDGEPLRRYADPASPVQMCDRTGLYCLGLPSSDNWYMPCFVCGSSVLRNISRAMAKSAAARLRGVGALSVASGWERKAMACERCHLRVIQGGTSYCGRPFLENIDRDLPTEGCGCPCRAKARTPGEHCPLTPGNQPSSDTADGCNCKWCVETAVGHAMADTKS